MVPDHYTNARVCLELNIVVDAAGSRFSLDPVNFGSLFT